MNKTSSFDFVRQINEDNNCRESDMILMTFSKEKKANERDRIMFCNWILILNN